MSSSLPRLCRTSVSLPLVRSPSSTDCAVTYRDGSVKYISNPTNFPEVADPKSKVVMVEEPMGEVFVLNRGRISAHPASQRDNLRT